LTLSALSLADLLSNLNVARRVAIRQLVINKDNNLNLALNELTSFTFITLFQLSTWVAATIVTEKSVEKRANMFINFIETAKVMKTNVYIWCFIPCYTGQG